MYPWLKLPLAAAAVAIAGGAGTAGAAPGNAGSAPAGIENARAGVDVTLVHHTYWHSRYQRDRWYRRHYGWRPPPRYYYYGPRCYWSRYWHRTICR